VIIHNFYVIGSATEYHKHYGQEDKNTDHRSKKIHSKKEIISVISAEKNTQISKLKEILENQGGNSPNEY